MCVVFLFYLSSGSIINEKYPGEEEIREHLFVKLNNIQVSLNQRFLTPNPERQKYMSVTKKYTIYSLASDIDFLKEDYETYLYVYNVAAAHILKQVPRE